MAYADFTTDDLLMLLDSNDDCPWIDTKPYFLDDPSEILGPFVGILKGYDLP